MRFTLNARMASILLVPEVKMRVLYCVLPSADQLLLLGIAEHHERRRAGRVDHVDAHRRRTPRPSPRRPGSPPGIRRARRGCTSSASGMSRMPCGRIRSRSSKPPVRWVGRTMPTVPREPSGHASPSPISPRARKQLAQAIDHRLRRLLDLSYHVGQLAAAEPVGVEADLLASARYCSSFMVASNAACSAAMRSAGISGGAKTGAPW